MIYFFHHYELPIILDQIRQQSQGGQPAGAQPETPQQPTGSQEMPTQPANSHQPPTEETVAYQGTVLATETSQARVDSESGSQLEMSTHTTETQLQSSFAATAEILGSPSTELNPLRQVNFVDLSAVGTKLYCGVMPHDVTEDTDCTGSMSIASNEDEPLQLNEHVDDNTFSFVTSATNDARDERVKATSPTLSEFCAVVDPLSVGCGKLTDCDTSTLGNSISRNDACCSDEDLHTELLKLSADNIDLCTTTQGVKLCTRSTESDGIARLRKKGPSTGD